MNIFPSTSAGRLGATVVAVIALLATVLAVLLAPTAHAQSIRYVNVTASGANDGSSWANAYTSLQDALTAATSGDEIWVAAGTYYPDVGDGLAEHDRTHSFQLKTGVALYGGFAGTETTRDQRDWATNVTTLSGDLQQDDGPDFANMDDNSYQIVFSDGVDRTAVLDGFTVTGGNADSGGGNIFPTDDGGGMVNFNSSPTLTNVTIRGNQAIGRGGGLYNDGSNPTLTNVTISDNWAYAGGGLHNDDSDPMLTNVTIRGNRGGLGGGLYNFRSNPVLTNVTIRGNQADVVGGGVFNTGNSSPVLRDVKVNGNRASGSGGGVFNTGNSSPVLRDVEVNGNRASGSGGGLYVDSDSDPMLTNVTISGNQSSREGGGLYMSISNPILTNVTISGNQADAGGGMFNIGSNPMLMNVVVRGNQAGGSGGGLFNYKPSRPVLTNVTVSGNQAGHEGGGLFNREGSRPTIQNSIFWGNSAPNGAEVVNDDSSPSYTHSLVQGEDLTSVGMGNLDGIDVDNDSLFVAPEIASSAPTTAGDYRLLLGSAAIDTGDNRLLPSDSTDLDGDSDTTESLPVDHNGNPRVVGDQVDLGAYEYDPAMPIVTWPAPATMTYGTALGDAQLNATANVPGSFRYTPATDTILDVGEGQVLQVVFTPDDTVTYTTVTTTVHIDVRVPLTNTVYLPLLRVR